MTRWIVLGSWLLASASACTGGGDDVPAVEPCEPRAGGPFWVLEGETVTATVSCATGHALTAAETVTFDPMPPGATWDAATSTLTWTPALDQAAVWDLAIDVAHVDAEGAPIPVEDVGSVRIGVVDRWDDPANVPVVDPARYPLEYDLPVFHVTAAAPITDVDYVRAELVYRGLTYRADIKKRGAASLGYPKNSFTVKFDEDGLFVEPELPAWDGGFWAKRRICLTTTFDDNSYVRTRLAFELWSRMDPSHLPIQSYSAVVFLNGEYFGLYQVTDHIDADFLAAAGLWGGSNLYKAVNHDANFRLTRANGSAKATLHDGYEKKEGLPVEGQPGAFDDLDALVDLAATAPEQQFRDEIDQWIVRSDYEDWWIFASLIEADDSAGKNSYHAHDPRGGEHGAAWRYLPWDFNHSFGQTWQTERQAPDAHPEDYSWANGLFERFLGDPTFGDPLRARYGYALASGPLSEGEVLALVDAMAQEVERSARRDEAKWSAEVRSYGGWDWRDDFTTYDEEMAYLRAWIASRWQTVSAIY